MTALLLAICLTSTCPSALAYHKRPQLLAFKAGVVANKRSNSAWRQRHRRHRAPSGHFIKLSTRKRRNWPDSPPRLSHSPDRWEKAQLSIHESKLIQRPPVLDSMHLLHKTLDEPAHRLVHSMSLSGHQRHLSRASAADTEAPSSLPSTDNDLWSPSPSFGTRSTRSMSTASRNSNRLSLTLPIAPPTHLPSRPTPTTTSLPPTPRDTPTSGSPTDANDFIRTIAAQERRVLELREGLTMAETELNMAEAELARLREQWGAFASVRALNAMFNGNTPRPSISPAVDDDVEGKSRSIELDRRRTLLMSQQLNKEIVPVSRRRVICGGHTRALSLLSPAKPEHHSLLDLDGPLDGHKSPAKVSEPRFQNVGRLTPTQINKRASWAPRSSSPASINIGKPRGDEFKVGFRNFVEDLRQATVGDEPINGGACLHRRTSTRHAQHDGDADTIRASITPLRPPVATAFNDPTLTPTPSPRISDVPPKKSGTANLGQPKRTASNRAKTFSLTPLTLESFHDDDWLNWDRTLSTSPHCSRVTVSGGDIATPTAEKGDDSDRIL